MAKEGKRIGRPPGRTQEQLVALRMPSELVGKIDAYAADQREPMSRSEALRQIVTRFLRSKGYLAK
jgi:metal-responsive CopG/Arc/MetJ family transcriptional regulator